VLRYTYICACSCVAAGVLVKVLMCTEQQLFEEQVVVMCRVLTYS
jgi:hypothetical protein